MWGTAVCGTSVCVWHYSVELVLWHYCVCVALVCVCVCVWSNGVCGTSGCSPRYCATVQR